MMNYCTRCFLQIYLHFKSSKTTGVWFLGWLTFKLTGVYFYSSTPRSSLRSSALIKLHLFKSFWRSVCNHISTINDNPPINTRQLQIIIDSVFSLHHAKANSSSSPSSRRESQRVRMHPVSDNTFLLRSITKHQSCVNTSGEQRSLAKSSSQLWMSHLQTVWLPQTLAIRHDYNPSAEPMASSAAVTQIQDREICYL